MSDQYLPTETEPRALKQPIRLLFCYQRVTYVKQKVVIAKYNIKNNYMKGFPWIHFSLP